MEGEPYIYEQFSNLANIPQSVSLNYVPNTGSGVYSMREMTVDSHIGRWEGVEGSGGGMQRNKQIILL